MRRKLMSSAAEYDAQQIEDVKVLLASAEAETAAAAEA